MDAKIADPKTAIPEVILKAMAEAFPKRKYTVINDLGIREVKSKRKKSIEIKAHEALMLSKPELGSLIVFMRGARAIVYEVA